MFFKLKLISPFKVETSNLILFYGKQLAGLIFKKITPKFASGLSRKKRYYLKTTNP